MAIVDDHLIELTISVVLAYGSYLLADAFDLSGVIATVDRRRRPGQRRARAALTADAASTRSTRSGSSSPSC